MRFAALDRICGHEDLGTRRYFDVHVARPDLPEDASAPVVLVPHELFSVNADIRATCAELADHGFTALAPDLFWRTAPGLDLNACSEADWRRGSTPMPPSAIMALARSSISTMRRVSPDLC